MAQFFGPEQNKGDITTVQPFLEETNPPAEVKAILKESCFDCHSNATRYPWYGKITPVDYWMADHIKHGKEHFNVSTWSEANLKKKDHKMEELIEMVEEKEMPLPSYTWTHTESKLSDEQIASMVAWAKNVRAMYAQQMK